MSCYYREYCNWNNYTKKFEDCDGYEEASLFKLNDNETMLTHVIEDRETTYYISSSKRDVQYDVWTFNATSDTGNDYYFVLDPKNKQVRIVFKSDGEMKMVRFYVKAIFR
ncbi:hypothetical protein AB9P05_00440 [Roseivirga sp. BDSF3-8]|uniref:hypothetical protein n=1 Tax=Roseivirga sp. BDSF3-8 TaxID=3241598 RepID=UPI0035319198